MTTGRSSGLAGIIIVLIFIHFMHLNKSLGTVDRKPAGLRGGQLVGSMGLPTGGPQNS